MKQILQNKYMDDERQDCYAAVIACFLDLDSPDDCIQIQDYYPEEDTSEDVKWTLVLFQWLLDRGWILEQLDDHLYTNEYYLVHGTTSRGLVHVCIYLNGDLFWDPHPSNEGLIEEDCFEILTHIGFLQ